MAGTGRPEGHLSALLVIRATALARRANGKYRRRMGRGAKSFLHRTAVPSRVARLVSDAASELRRPSCGLVFVSGALAQRLEQVGDALVDARLPYPIVVAAGSGVLSELGEVEDESACSGVLWSGGRAEAVPIAATDADELGEALARTLTDRTGKTSPTVLVFANPDGFGPSVLAPLQEARTTPHLFGAGTIGHPGSLAVSPGDDVAPGPIALILRGSAAPAIRTAHSCRLLSPLRVITEAQGAMVRTIDGQPALDVLSELGRSVAGQPLIFTVLAEAEGTLEHEGNRPALIVRGVQGIDSERRSLLISDEVYEGMRITFAVRDAKAARDDLEAVVRELSRDIAGAAPRFAIYLNCAGRGSGLYGTPDVDTRILRSRFGDIPMAGMQSSFEIAPHLGRPTLQLYTGVLGLFSALS